MSNPSGVVLTAQDIDEVAVRIDDMWRRYNDDRSKALSVGEEARGYVFGLDIDGTTASILPHKNRTHQPKLTSISDALQSEYYSASLSSPEFFKFSGDTAQDKLRAEKVEKWLRVKLEQRKFRDTVGRELLNDYVQYGNCFAQVDYVTEKDENGVIVYRGPEFCRISPLDIVMNPRARSFRKAPKIQREFVHVADLAMWPEEFPLAGFNQAAIDKAVHSRRTGVVDDWVKTLKERGIQMDGFGSMDDYYMQDMVEVLIYRGDIYNPDTGEAQRHRIVYVVDKVHVIRNEPIAAPKGMDGLHHAGWRIRQDNLWAQGPLDNLIGMQYRIDHLENLKADVFDIIAQPVIVITGDGVVEPEEGWSPGAVYYAGVDEKVEMLRPDTTALNADTQIAQYHKMMEDFAGAVPQKRGIRTPGEKTAFEVDKLDEGGTAFFVDKARNFERMLESMLKEAFELMLINYDGNDYVELFDDVTGEAELKQLSQEDVNARGSFVAIGSRHWQRKQRLVTEMTQFMQGPFQDPKIRYHVKGTKLAEMYNTYLDFDGMELFEEYAGVKEDVHAQAIAQSEAAQLQEQTGEADVRTGDVSGTGTEVQPGPEDTGATPQNNKG